jgi:hypothetical protein
MADDAVRTAITADASQANREWAGWASQVQAASNAVKTSLTGIASSTQAVQGQIRGDLDRVASAIGAVQSRFAAWAALLAGCIAQPAGAAPCVEAYPMAPGQPAECSGVLVPDDVARDSLRLARVENPQLQAALQREEDLHRIDLQRDAKIKASLEAALKQTASDTSDASVIKAVAVGAAALILGALGGYLAAQ